MDNGIFRQKNVQRMQSPDNLKEYIKVVNPGIWFVFIAAFILLVGAFVWGTFGTIEDKVTITAVCQNGTIQCEYNDMFEKDMPVVIDENKGFIVSVDLSGITVEMEKTLPDGVYSGYVIVGSISPISFIFN